MTGFFKKYNTGLKWVKLTLGVTTEQITSTKKEIKIGPSLKERNYYDRVRNSSWNVMSLLSNFMKPVSLYNPTKDKKTKAFSCLERVYRDRPVA